MKCKAIILLCVCLATGATAFACGPHFPNAYVEESERILLSLPGLCFSAEVAQILAIPLTTAPRERSQSTSSPKERWSELKMTAMVDIEELQAALWERGDSAAEVADTVAEYERLRESLTNYAIVRAATEDRGRRYSWRNETVLVPEPFDVRPFEYLLGKIPLEFAEYFRGAAAYHSDCPDEAVEHWNNVLNLPPKERARRGPWATYMVGRALVKVEPQRAITLFEEHRRSVQDGTPDPLGLADASVGWQARAEGEAGDYAAAIHRYVECARREETRGMALVSLDWVCEKICREGMADARLWQDDLCRALITTWAIRSSGYRRWSSTLLSAFQAAGLGTDVSGADRLAWMAYKAGDMAAAAQWLEFAEPESVYAQWVRAKLLLREGNVDDGLALLAGLRQRLSRQPSGPVLSGIEECSAAQRIAAESGIVILREGRYVEALRAFLESGSWYDAAYIAECVFSTEELTVFLDSSENTSYLDLPCNTWCWHNWGESVRDRFRHTLASRLADQGMWDDALARFPDRVRENAEATASCIRRGRDDGRPSRERAMALFEAGKLLRENGLELIGRELAPDWRIEGGTLVVDDWFSASRRKISNESAWGATEDERARVARHAAQPQKRYHYRYVAADMMWECASLLPDNDPLTAEALYLGGTYLKDRDPAAADRFYKALVRRNPNLLIARQADKLRWFPKKFTAEVLYVPVRYWTKRRIAALVSGGVLALVSVAGMTAFLFVRRSRRDSAGAAR